MAHNNFIAWYFIIYPIIIDNQGSIHIKKLASKSYFSSKLRTPSLIYTYFFYFLDKP